MKTQIIDLVGLTRQNPLVDEFMRAIELDGEKIKLKRGDSEVALEAEKYGVDVNFIESKARALPEGSMVISAIFLYAEGVQGHSQFDGALPCDLKFGATRPEIRKQLGTPSWSSPAMPIDRWSMKDYGVTVWFTGANESIGHVIVHLPK
jgi:hypothetical protein